jgi:hypothetical protein
MSVLAAPTVSGAVAAPIRRYDVMWKWLPLILVFGAAVAMRHLVVANTDVSWEITLSEKILDGQRLYSDLIELNPPASTLLYLPAVVLARALGFVPEIIVDALVFIGALVSLLIVSRIVYRCRLFDELPGSMVAAAALAVLTILPAQAFGQREHIALIAVLPALATLAVRATGAKPLLWHCLVAGAGAGVTVCIKPHFALALIFAAMAAALHLRSWRVLFALENCIAAAVVIVYGICVVVFFRAYITEMMPLVADVYLPVRWPLIDLLVSRPMLLWTGAFLAVCSLERSAGNNPISLLLMASVGFAAAYIIQGKGWPYHSYPMLALVLIALCLAIAYRSSAAQQAGARDDLKSFGAMAVFAIVAALSFAWFNLAVDTRAAAAAVKRIAPPHPSIIVISDDIAIGHPLVREVQGRWISRVCSRWIMGNAAGRIIAGGLDETTKERLAADMKAERQRLVDEIRDGKPDIILVDKHVPFWSEWITADRDLSTLVAASYREVESADGIAVLKRQSSSGNPQTEWAPEALPR